MASKAEEAEAELHRVLSSATALSPRRGGRAAATAEHTISNDDDETIELLEGHHRLMLRIINILDRELSRQRQERIDVEELQALTLTTFFQNIGAISTLGSSFTFALIVSQLQDPAEVSRGHRFDLSTVRIFIATSWLLFTVTLVLGILLAIAIKNTKDAKWKKRQRRLSIIILYSLIGAALILLSLTVAAYVDVVGFLMLGLILFYPAVVWPAIWYLRGLDELVGFLGSARPGPGGKQQLRDAGLI
ncbi:uncharacterized protein DNG_10136 [Cephalotrichum gorgonifer]|uniref:PGG domain-containing protein n=1 Tax=Cephalotrichum gorgonifer TaxID=2041049 RepID=A0AAE8T0J1_9PEZI|nr:uncharacterized protein DNG_10136 [Cephalotrichum gorgonifer]